MTMTIIIKDALHDFTLDDINDAMLFKQATTRVDEQMSIHKTTLMFSLSRQHF